MNKTYHTLRRDDGSVSVYYTVDGDPAHYVVFDTLDATPDLAVENARLREALQRIASGIIPANPFKPELWLSVSEMAEIARIAIVQVEVEATNVPH